MSKNQFLSVAGLSILTAIAFTWLLLWVIPGVNMVIFYLIFVLGVLIIMSRVGRLKTFKSYFPLLILFFISTITLYRTNNFYMFLLFLILPFVAYIFSVQVWDQIKKFGLIQLILLPLTIPIVWLIDIFRFLKDLPDEIRKASLKNSSNRQYLIGFLASIPFFVIFLALFSSADAVFNNILENTFGNWDLMSLLDKLFSDEETFKTVFNIFFTFISFFYFLAIYHAVYRGKSGWDRVNKKFEIIFSKIKSNWYSNGLGIFLFPLNILFGSFVWVQLEYLFAGEENVLGSGIGEAYTYSEYARRGFVELLTVSFIVFLIIALLQSKVDLKKAGKEIFYKVNAIFFLVLTFVIALSALSRIALLIEVYGFTNVRMFGFVVMLALTVLIPVVIYAIYSEKRFVWFNKLYALFVIGTLAILVVLPTDLIVAHKNISRYESTDQIDIQYLFSLSPEAQVYVAPYLMSEDRPEEISALSRVFYFEQYEEFEKEESSWLEFNLMRYRYEMILQEQFENLE